MLHLIFTCDVTLLNLLDVPGMYMLPSKEAQTPYLYNRRSYRSKICRVDIFWDDKMTVINKELRKLDT